MGFSWIIPRRNKGRLEASLQLGYQGLRQLAYRSGQVKQIDAYVIHDGDQFDYRYEIPAGWVLDWKPAGEPGRDWSHVFASAETVLGGRMVEVMTKAEVYAHRDRYVKEWQKSKGWKDNEPEMARKTVLARLCRQLPMSSEFRNAMVADGSSPREVAPDLAGLTALEAAEVEEVEDE
jgi:recombination protein RecT